MTHVTLVSCGGCCFEAPWCLPKGGLSQTTVTPGRCDEWVIIELSAAGVTIVELDCVMPYVVLLQNLLGFERSGTLVTLDVHFISPHVSLYMCHKCHFNKHVTFWPVTFQKKMWD